MPKHNDSKASTRNLAQLVQTKLLLVFALLIVLLMIVQSIILGVVGTLGPEISQVSTEIESLKLDNEIKLSQIRDFQTQSQIIPVVENDLEMTEAEVARLELIELSNSIEPIASVNNE